MSFSSSVKEELSSLSASLCCQAAEAYGMAQCGRSFGATLSLQTESHTQAERYAERLAKVGNVSVPTVQIPSSSGGFYQVFFSQEDCAAVKQRFGHALREAAVRINRANLECEDCAAAYLRGAFLVCGTISNPETGYHLEFCVPYYHLSRDIARLLTEAGLQPRIVRRKGNYVVYLKESAQIEDCLTLMGATNASLELMSIKIVKDIRNNANRVANCENANIDKTVAAASEQRKMLLRLREKSGGFEQLSPQLRELAELRLENPELSLRELGELLDPPLTRSGVNHRLQRLAELAGDEPKKEDERSEEA